MKLIAFSINLMSAILVIQHISAEYSHYMNPLTENQEATTAPKHPKNADNKIRFVQ